MRVDVFGEVNNCSHDAEFQPSSPIESAKVYCGHNKSLGKFDNWPVVLGAEAGNCQAVYR